jgi:hypothetical protein
MRDKLTKAELDRWSIRALTYLATAGTVIVFLVAVTFGEHVSFVGLIHAAFSVARLCALVIALISIMGVLNKRAIIISSSLFLILDLLVPNALTSIGARSLLMAPPSTSVLFILLILGAIATRYWSERGRELSAQQSW